MRQNLHVSRSWKARKVEDCSELKETKENCQLDPTLDPPPDPSAMKDIVRAIGESGMGSDRWMVATML